MEKETHDEKVKRVSQTIMDLLKKEKLAFKVNMEPQIGIVAIQDEPTKDSAVK
jgi:NADPH-dependent 7-cyano-7-deazaguanine reductase QueF